MDSEEQRVSRNQLCVSDFIITMRMKVAKSSGNSSACSLYCLLEYTLNFDLIFFNAYTAGSRTFILLLLYVCFRFSEIYIKSCGIIR